MQRTQQLSRSSFSRPMFSLALAGLCALLSSTAVAANNDLVQLITRFTEAQRTFQPAILAELTTADYVEVSPLGELDPRDKMLGFYGPENKIDPPPMTMTDTIVRTFGDAAVVITTLTYQVKYPDNTVHATAYRDTFVAHLTSSGWKLVSAQYTAVRPHKTP